MAAVRLDFHFRNICQKFKLALISTRKGKCIKDRTIQRQNYCGFSIFNMAADCHLGFQNFRIFLSKIQISAYS